MATRQLTDFEHVLLGMICATPSSGYDLKGRFATTPLGVYQPSSGALYPALRRLERKGLIRSEAASAPAVRAARRRHVYEPTAPGRAAHAGWVCMPVEAATVSRDLGLHLMRFVMMEPLLPRAEVLQFVCSLRDALAASVADLERFVATSSFDNRHAGLALDHGVAIHRASLEWAEQTIATLTPVPR